MPKILLILWPSFLVAAIAEAIFFTVIDPQELYLFGQAVHYSKTATYSIGFLGFWCEYLSRFSDILVPNRTPGTVGSVDVMPATGTARWSAAAAGSSDRISTGISAT